MKRRDLLACAGVAGLAAAAQADDRTAAARGKTLRIAFRFAETGFDPPRVSDNSSLTIVENIFESPLTFDYLARPAKVRPWTATSMPEVRDNHRHWVFTIRPGIFFSDDPVFGGRPRELTAADYVYSIKRFYDPAVVTDRLYLFENAKVLGLSELRRRALADKTPFPYDVEVPGLRAIDRWRFEVRLAEPDPRFLHTMAAPQNAGAVAREVVEAYAADLMAHPVGTGAFRLAQWRRSSLVVLERNPRYRRDVFDADPPHDDPVAQAAAAYLRGRTVPLVDRIEAHVIDESQPRWLAFAGGQLDMLLVPPTLGSSIVPGGELAPYLVRRGVRAQRTVGASITHTFFNCTDEQVGGNQPHRVALRRAVAMAFDNAAVVRLLLNGGGVPAQSMIAPHNYGYDPTLRSEMAAPSPGRANALLDTYGYDRRDADGWRLHPDGRALTLRLASSDTQAARRANEMWERRMRAIGLRIRFETAPFGELIRRSMAGKLQMWGFEWQQGPDGGFHLGLAYGPNADQSNDARFSLPAFDRLYEQQRVMPDGPERLAVMRQANRLMLAYMPYIPHYHVIDTDVLHRHVHGWVRHPFLADVLRFVDVTPEGPG